MSDRYDHRGRLLDGPDDPDDAACIPHGNRVADCRDCLAAFEAEEREYKAWRATQPAYEPDLSDLPY